MNIIKRTFALLTIFTLHSISFALPTSQAVKGNTEFKLNRQNIQFIFNENSDDAPAQLIMKNKLKKQQFSIAELPYQSTRHIYFADYNFDGLTDFSISAPDMGMGVYQVFDIFLYQPKTQNFEVIDQEKFDFSHSQCTAFTDIRLFPTKRQMSSSCRGGARWWTDTYQFNKGQWRWIKSKDESE